MLYFPCACGKRLAVQDALAGKMVKCPACSKTLRAQQPAFAPGRRSDADDEPIPPPPQMTISDPEARSRSSANEETLGKGPSGAEVDDEPAAHDFLRPGKSSDELGRLGHFRILKELGRGGMGAVYLAEDLRLLRQVALKVMLPRYASHTRSKERFLREARLAASIEHDHIIGIFEVDEDHGIPFLTMPVLKGESLQGRLQRESSLCVGEVLRIGWQVCQGLQAAHERDLVHRDLKPGNLWLEGTRGRVKILDFGLARAVHTDQHLTNSGAVVGTPAYMAPEQARNPKVDGRADLFSLGVVLYRCLAGHAPFTGHDALSVILSICNDEPAPLGEVMSDIPPEISNLITKLLQKEPGRRFVSAEEAGFALEAIDRKYFLGQAIPGSSLPPSAIQNIPIAQPVTVIPAVPTLGVTGEAPRPKPTANNINPFAFDGPRNPMQPAPPPAKRPVSLAETTAPMPSRGFPTKGIVLLIGLGLVVLLPVLMWQIIIRITDEKGNVREFPVKPGEKIEIVQNPKVLPADGRDPDLRAAAWVISLGGTVTIDDGKERAISAAKELPAGPWTLRKIDFHDKKQVDDTGLKQLTKLKGLQWLDLWNTQVTDAGLTELAGLTSLQTLVLYGTKVTDAGLRELAGLKSLRMLTLDSTKVTDAGLKELAGLRSLQLLALHNTKVTDAGLKEMAAMINLQDLGLSGTKVTDAGLKELAGLKSLRWIDLGGDKVADAGLKELASLKSLKGLALSSTQVTDAGLKEIAGLKSFQTLLLQNTKVTDVGLKEMAGLTSLQTLDLRDTKVTDDGLKHLSGLSALRELNLSDTQVTANGAAAFAKALPMCKVIRGGVPVKRE